MFESTTSGEIADKLDKFFQDPANGRMVASAVYYLSREAAGGDRVTLSKLVAALTTIHLILVELKEK